MGSWLVLEAAVLLALCAFAAWGGAIAFLVLGGLTAPYLGLQLALAQSMASGNTGWSAVWETIRDDWRANSAAYLRAATVRMMGLFFGLHLLQWLLQPLPTAVPAVPINPLLFGARSWSLAWLACMAFSVSGPVSFLVWLVWKHRLDWRLAWRLDREALLKNPHGLAMLLAVLFCALVCALFLPLLLPAGAVFLSCVMRAAYADIFDDGSGLQEVRAPAPRRQGLPLSPARVGRSP